jgi:hypothetical protein
MKKYNYSSNEKIFTQKIHTSCSYNNMKTYTISKKKQKKKTSNAFLSLNTRFFCPENDSVRKNRDKKFRITIGSVFLFDLASSIIADVPKSLALHLLHCKPPRIAWLEIDHSRDRAYPTAPQDPLIPQQKHT